MKKVSVIVILLLSVVLLSQLVLAAEQKWGNIDWQQFKGIQLNVLATAMPVAEVYKGKIAVFEALTGIKVNFELLNDVDRRKKQLVDFASGMGEYDVSNVGFSNREEFVQPGYLEPLDVYLNNPKLTDSAWYNLADYPKDVLAAGTSNGKIIMIPFTAEYFLLWYNKDVFTKLGLKPPKTPAELKEVAGKLDQARKDGKIEQFAFVDRNMAGASEGGWNLFCTAHRMGFDFVDFKTVTSNANTPKGIEAMKFYTDMAKFGPPGSGNWTWGDIGSAFSQGKLSMAVAGNASYAYLEDVSKSKVAGKVGYATPPMEGGKDPLWIWGWAISASSKNKEASWLLVQWLTSPNLIAEMAPLYGCPARKSVYALEDYKKAMPSQEFIDSQLWMLDNGIDPYTQFVLTPKYGEVSDLVSKEMNAVVAGIKTPEQACADADAALVKIGFKSSASK
ncbi:MAG: sugar ABC transporter substrate-binding protein [Candidatus Atribacteria bacterium]|nr:sugar ABC transporter substrate-binding protein [Candidatus Atribacteria bacterium]